MGKKEIFLISLVFFLTTIAWIIIDIYHTAVASKVKPVNLEFVKPINLNIDKLIFKLLETKD